MGETTLGEQEKQRRRKRVQKLKKIILYTIAGWFVFSLFAIITLGIIIGVLNQKIDSLEEQLQAKTSFQQDADSEMASLADVSQELILESMDAEANLASEEDIHKVYLTFEGGPSENTEKILDILAEHGVKATFFVTGREDEDSAAIYQRIVDEGHTLGMRSFSNSYSEIYSSQEAFEADLLRLQEYLQEVTGVNSQYYRFPGGSGNQLGNVSMKNLISFVNEQGITYVDWNVSGGDSAVQAFSSQKIVDNVLADVKKYKTSVVLLHDATEQVGTVEALGPLLDELESMDAEVLAISEDTDKIQFQRVVPVGGIANK